ncbi:hypothetical protein [Lysinibacillus endophyticus]|uniref:Uncharacterized protein n=1 Tax=Ureibacillus endophyticus TaxID=1978490 RepID=A0A494Z7Y8_9BACL|nr:hypothetical protein [Lysinibacillus endophyticus]MCP1145039.1 hypothetical protein [Lysinibacillus endophyticus]RKQ18465.1 hypothetical protein D8M03_05310 [Lysinibacillus endophyticus]
MFNYFRYLAATVAIAGVVLLVLSFFVSVSIWFGIELVKSGIFLYMFGLFMQLFEHESSKRRVEKT